MKGKDIRIFMATKKRIAGGLYRRKRSVLLFGVIISLAIQAQSVFAASAQEGFQPALGLQKESLELASSVALAVDLNTGYILYAQNEEQAFVPVGGAVSLMTAKLAAEKLSMDGMVEVDDAIDAVPEDSCTIGLEKGDRPTVRDLEAAVLLYGAQDAAAVLAKAAGGSPEKFSEMMNADAKSAGMAGTAYTNGMGAYDAAQKTTAEDLALMATSAYRNKELYGFLTMRNYDFESKQLSPEGPVRNRNEIMLNDSSVYDERVDGAVSGATLATGAELMAYAQINRMPVLIVLAGAPRLNGAFQDTGILLDHIGRRFESLDLSEQAARLVGELGTEETRYSMEAGAVFPAVVCRETYDASQLRIVLDTPGKTDGAASALLYYGKQKIGGIALKAEQNAARTPEATDTVSSAAGADDGEPVLYPSENQKQVKTGWIKWFAGGAVVLLAVIISARIVARRMH